MDFFTKQSNNEMSRVNFQERCRIAKNKEKNETKSRIVIVAVIWLAIIAYLVSPISKSRIVSLSGNIMLSNDDIYEIGEFSKNSLIWNIDNKEVEKTLATYDYISSAKINKTIFGLNINLDEVSVVGKNGKACSIYGDECTYYLSNGNEINGYNDYRANNVKHIGKFGDIPYIDNIAVLSENQKEILFKQLGEVEKEVRNKIDLITPNANNGSVVDVTFNKDDLGMSHDLLLQVDISSLANKLTKKNIDYLKQGILEQSSPNVKNGKYCYIYRSDDMVLPCQG